MLSVRPSRWGPGATPSTRPERSGSRKPAPTASLTSNSGQEGFTVQQSSSLLGQRGQLLLRVHVLFRLHLVPAAVGPQRPAEGVVREPDGQYLRQPGLERGIEYGSHRLHAAVEVALHHVRRPDVVARPAAIAAEAEDARMLEEVAHDRADPDPLGEAGDAGPEHAHAAHD